MAPSLWEDGMTDRTILELAYERETLLQQPPFPHPGMPPGARPFGGNKDRETYRKELIEELTTKILDLRPRNDREAIIQLGCIVDQWKPRLESGEQRPGARTEALHRVVAQLVDLLREHS
jgi:hypothetical protein